MAQIAKEARMSPGHIYHYFDSKKDIIAAIIRQHDDARKHLIDEYRDAEEGVVDHMINNLGASIERNTDLFWSTLLLDITAEATRNEEIGEVVRASDADIRAAIVDNLRDGVNPEDLETRFEVMLAIMQGLGIRQVLHPDFDKAGVMQLVKGIIELLFRPPPGTAAANGSVP